MKYRKIYDNEQAVSPIVATLVLVVVAIAGAAAVGTILGSFSSDVSDQASAGTTAEASSMTILVAGSTSVAPLAEALKSGFEESHAGTTINVQEGGDSAAIAGTGIGTLDIGLLSRDMTDKEEDKYPNLKTHKIGASAVVIIGGEKVATKFNANNSTLTPHDLHEMYETASVGGSTTAINLTDGNTTPTDLTSVTVYKRDEGRSGPEYTFSSYIGHGDGDFIAGTNAIAVTGDEEMLEAIANDPDGLGFVDFRFALEAEEGGMDVNFIGVTDHHCTLTSHCVEETHHMMHHIEGALNGETMSDGSDMYPDDLLTNMYMITNGYPSSLEARFINFAQLPDSIPLYEDAGYFNVLQITGEGGSSDHSGHDH